MNGESTIQVKINLMQLLTPKCLKTVIEDNRLTLLMFVCGLTFTLTFNL